MAIETIKLKSGDKRFRVVVRWGHQTVKSPSFRSRAEAKRRDVQAMDLKAVGQSPVGAWAAPEVSQTSLTVRAWALNVWLPEVVLAGDRPVATATARSYVEAFEKRLQPFSRPGCSTTFADLTFADFDREGPIIVSEMRSWLAGRGCEPPTVSRYMAALSSCLSEAVSRGRLLRNPVFAASRKRGGRQTNVRPVRALSAVQIEQVRKAILDRSTRDATRRLADALLVTLLYAEGLRPGEALFLRWHHLGRTALSVEGAVSLGEEKATKTGGVRQVDLFAVVREELAHWRLCSPSRGDEDLVLPRFSDGLPWEDHDFRNWRRRVWQPAVGTVSLANPSWTTLARATPYFCRHTSATGRLYAQEHPGRVAEQHGHGVAVLHQYYSHVLQDRTGEEGQPWDEQLRDARTSVFGGSGDDR